MKPYSITHRLIGTVLLLELICASCIIAMAFGYERHMHFRAFDVMLRGRADVLLGAVQDAEDADDNVMLDGTQINLPSEDIYEVHDDDGRFLGRSKNWAGSPERFFLTAVPRPVGFIENGRRYRVIVVHGARIVDPADKDGGRLRRVTIVYGAPVDDVWRAVLGAAGFYALTSGALMALTGLLMAWFLHRALTPLHDLAGEAAKVSSTSWSFHSPEGVQEVKELAPLHQALETLLHGLEQAFLKQRRFTRDAAHELKTSVAVVKSSLQLLSMKQRTPAEYQAGLERCLTDCARMEEIVLRMLALARAEQADTFPRENASLTACVQEAVDHFASMAELQYIRVNSDVADGVTVALPPEECALLFSNLLLNSLQHSAAHGEVSISAAEQEGRVRIRITDKGDGIAAEDLPHVFEQFYRGDPSRNRNTGGSGLGLAICKALVEQAQGSIYIESRLNLGTTVIVELPAGETVDASPIFGAESAQPSA